MSLVLRTLLLMVAMAAPSVASGTQLEFVDIESGYWQNLQQLKNRDLQISWTTRQDLDPANVDYVDNRRAAFQAAIKAAPGEIEQRRLASYSMTMFKSRMEPSSCQLFLTKSGFCLRFYDGDAATLPELFDEFFPPGLDGFASYTYKFGEAWCGMTANATSIGRQTYSVREFEPSLIYRDDTPFPWYANQREIQGQSMMDILFPPTPSALRSTADVEVTLGEPNIAIIKIHEHPEKLPDIIKFGSRLYAEVDMSKGFLPRKIYVSPICSIRGKLYGDRFGDRWMTQSDIEIGQYHELYFPSKIITSQYASKPDVASQIEWLLKPMDELDRYVIEWGRADPDPIGKILAVTTSVVLTDWQVPDVDFLGLTPPKGANRTYDGRTGHGTITRDAMKGLALDLDRIPDINATDVSFWGALSRWPFWIGLVCLATLCLIVAYGASRFMRRQGRMPME